MTKQAPGPQARELGAEGPAKVAAERRLPGRAQPGEEVLAEYREFNSRRRARIPSVLWVFWAPEPDDLYRWRVELDCRVSPR
jgi:hypothetical protein